MSFVLDAEDALLAPPLSLEDALALLDATDGSASAGCSSSWCSGASDTSTSNCSSSSPALDDDPELDLNLDLELLAASDLSWPEPEDAAGSDLAALLLAPIAGEQLVVPRESTPAESERTPPGPVEQNKQLQQQRRKRKAAAAAPPTRSSTKATPAASESGRARKNAKTEILELRELAEELQARLAQLQRRSGSDARTAARKRTGSGTSDRAIALPMASSVWLEAAVDEFKALQKAEELNAKLHTEVKRQAGLSKTLQLLFTKKTAQLGVADYVLALTPPPGSVSSTHHARGARTIPVVESLESESDADSLFRRVESMHIEADTVRLKIAAESDFSSMFSSTRTRNDAAFGPVVELKTNTPVNHADYRQLARLFWTRACKSNGTFGTETVTHFASEMYERPVWMKMASPLGELVLNGVIAMCKVEEDGRSVITFASTVVVTSHPRLRFCEHGWMIAGEHESDASKSLFQTFYQVRAERRPSGNGVDPASRSVAPPPPHSVAETDDTLDDDVALRDVVMSSLGENMRAFYHEIQKMLHAKDKVAAIANFSRACPLDNFKRLIRSFLQFDAEAPALTLEETLAFLESFDGDASATESSSSGGGSPGGWDDDNLDTLYAATSASDSAATTVAGSSSSEPSWSDSDDASLLSLLLLPSPQHQVSVSLPEDAMMMTSAPPEPVVAAAVTPATQPQPPRPKRKAAPSVTSSPRAATKADAPASEEPVKRRVRKQPKTEILRLRDQVEELQARLVQLQKTGASPGAGSALVPPPQQQLRSAAMAQKESERAKATPTATSSSPGPLAGASKWLDSAVDQFKALQKSEALNRKLKSEVARQARLGKTLKSMFSKKTAQQGMEFLKELETAKPTQTVVRECGGFGQLKKLLPGHSQRVIEAATAEDLYKSVEKMQIETDTVRREIAAESDASSVFSSSKIKHHHEFGPVFELKTNTPVNFPNFRELATMFWERAATGMAEAGQQPTEVDRFPEHETLITSKLHERPVSMTIKSQFGVLVLNGISVICKLEDMDRSVFTFAATLAVSGNRTMVFREHGWMIIMPHESDDDQSVFQTFYRLDSEKRRNTSTSALHHAASPDPAADSQPSPENSLMNDDVALRDIVMKALSDNMREFQNEIQNTLVSQQSSASFDTSKFPKSCPLHNIKVQMGGRRPHEATASS